MAELRKVLNTNTTRTVLGHNSIDVTEIYADADREKDREAMRKAGTVDLEELRARVYWFSDEIIDTHLVRLQTAQGIGRFVESKTRRRNDQCDLRVALHQRVR